jgi:hypothetical protein
MSDVQSAELVTAETQLKVGACSVQPCGCQSAIISRQRPAFDEKGHPKISPEGTFVMEMSEDIEESYCEEHSKVVAARQEAVQKLLVSGGSSEDALRLMLGTGTDFPVLVGHGDDGHDDGSEQ